MGRSAILKAAIKERQQGTPAEQVYKTYQGQVRPDKALAVAIASVPNPERKRRYAVLNYILVALLILAAAIKAFSVFFLFPQFSPGMMLGAVLLGILVPVIFAIGISRFDGRMYPLLIILCIANALNVVMRNQDGPLAVLPDLILLTVIVILAFVVKGKVFPNLSFFSVKKDPQGQYVW